EVIKCNSIIVDATHTKARYNQKSPKEILADRSKKLRKSVYEIDESMKVKFPSKSATNELGDEIEYCQKLMNVIENEEAISQYSKIKYILTLFKVCVRYDIEHLRLFEVEHEKIAHNKHDASLLVYNTPIAMIEERIIIADMVTNDEKNDGPQL